MTSGKHVRGPNRPEGACAASTPTGRTTTPLWKVSFLKSGVTTVPCADTGECGDIPTQIGITSTPVIDPTEWNHVRRGRYEGEFELGTAVTCSYITTGAEKFGGPVVITATVPGTGEGGTTPDLQWPSRKSEAGAAPQQVLVRSTSPSAPMAIKVRGTAGCWNTTPRLSSR